MRDASPPTPAAPTPPGGPGTVAFTVFFWLLFVTSSIALFPLLAAAHLIATPFDRDRRLTHALLSRIAFGYLRWNPWWDIRVEGRERLPRGPAVIVLNHQSGADVLVAMGLRHDFKFVSKASLFAIPILGWSMRLARYVSVHRARAKSIKQMMATCRAWLRRGVAVAIFPEGTYALDGRLLPFKKGAFVVAIGERAPVVPVVIEGSPSLVYDDGPLISPRCRIRVRVQPPIPASELGDDPVALARRVRALFAEALGQPTDAGPAPVADDVA